MMNLKRPIFATLVAASAFTLGPLAASMDVTPADIAEAAERRAKEIAAARKAFRTLDSARRKAVRNGKGSSNAAKMLSAQAEEAKARLAELNRTSPEEYAERLARDRAAAEEEARRIQAEKQASEKKAEEARVAQEKAEAERLRLSGGCPLELTTGGFFHSRGRFSGALGRAGPSTVAKFTVVNRSGDPVPAHELRVEFLDAFDRVISDHMVQGALLKPGEKFEAMNALPEAETATTMKVYLERVKLSDGSIWERKPEYRHTIFTWKKPEGAGTVD